ncbi:DegV family protein [Lactobacillaceae bacterium L1_55_11]|nr:DegV family protein [Lactobacillaceae bacterium L1_55_11]
MANIRIVTDSAAILTPEEIEQYGIVVVPLTVQIDGTVYQDGVTIHPKEFLDMMAKSDHLPQTSQPSIGDLKTAYDNLYAEDPDVEVLSLHLSSGLSGTISAAQQAASLSAASVTTFDTLLADRAEGFVVLAAAQAAAEGKDLDAVIAAATEAREQSHIYLSFTSLKNMVAGGRLSKTQGLIGNVLNIKVGAYVDSEGKVDVALKGRGMKTIAKFNDQVIDKMKQYKEMLSIGISHAGVPEEAQQLADRLNKIWPDLDILVSTTTPIVSTHTGLGALAILYRAR